MLGGRIPRPLVKPDKLALTPPGVPERGFDFAIARCGRKAIAIPERPQLGDVGVFADLNPTSIDFSFEPKLYSG